MREIQNKAPCTVKILSWASTSFFSKLVFWIMHKALFHSKQVLKLAIMSLSPLKFTPYHVGRKPSLIIRAKMHVSTGE